MEKKKKSVIWIGSAWHKEQETRDGNTFQYMSVSFKGGREEDEYEVVVRRKSDGQELDLFKKGTFVNLVNSKKTKENSPDMGLKVEFDE